jgi:hypothetical protein
VDILTTTERAWCAERISEYRGRHLTVADIEHVSSRLAGIWRINMRECLEAFYVKRYPPGEPRYAPLEVHFAMLQRIHAAVEPVPGLAPYKVIACLPSSRLIVSEEVPGAPLAMFHKSVFGRSAARIAAERAWAGIGKWLSVLHKQGRDRLSESASERSTSIHHALSLGEYVDYRLERWAEADPRFAVLARDAAAATDKAARALACNPMALVPCHGDVSTFNILVGTRIGLIDFDDLRLDLPEVDLSLVSLEIAQFARIGSTVTFPGLQSRFMRAFRAGYGRSWDRETAFQLAHLRNLAVILLTLARRRGPLSLSQLSTRAHYRWAIEELRSTLDSA